MRPLALIFLAVMAGHGECLPVQGDRILARHLAPAIPDFGQIPGDEPIGFAPAPGVRRTLSREELTRFAERFHLNTAVPASPVCVQLLLQTLTAERIVEAVKRTTEADVEVIEFSRYAVPEGEVQFLKSGVARTPVATADTVVLWRGRVLYANGKSWAIWARVKLGVQRDQWVAAGEIPAGATIAPGEMRLEPARVFPFGEAALEPQNAAGRTARRRIEKDQVITAGLLLPRNDVKRGDEVEVRVESGAATLRVHARAETSGRIGQPVMVKNPASGRNFRALVEGKGRVGVMADTGSTR